MKYYQNIKQELINNEIYVNETGIYYVAYTATDIAGNTSVMYFTFEVVDTSKPILSVQPVADDITISGNTVTYRVNASAHNGETTNYATHIYAYDHGGNVVGYAIDNIKVEVIE